MKEERRGSINRTETNMKIIMWDADNNKKNILDISMSSRRERRLVYTINTHHQLAENISALNNIDVINDFCKHYCSKLKYLGPIDNSIEVGQPVEELINEVVKTTEPVEEPYIKATLIPEKNKMN